MYSSFIMTNMSLILLILAATAIYHWQQANALRKELSRVRDTHFSQLKYAFSALQNKDQIADYFYLMVERAKPYMLLVEKHKLTPRALARLIKASQKRKYRRTYAGTWLPKECKPGALSANNRAFAMEAMAEASNQRKWIARSGKKPLMKVLSAEERATRKYAHKRQLWRAKSYRLQAVAPAVSNN